MIDFYQETKRLAELTGANFLRNEAKDVPFSGYNLELLTGLIFIELSMSDGMRNQVNLNNRRAPKLLNLISTDLLLEILLGKPKKKKKNKQTTR